MNRIVRRLAAAHAKLGEWERTVAAAARPTGPAPLGLSTTGDPAMNAPWSALGTPAISIPMPVANGLPLGLQMTADLGQDSRLIRAAIQQQTHLHAGPKISVA